MKKTYKMCFTTTCFEHLNGSFMRHLGKFDVVDRKNDITDSAVIENSKSRRKRF